MKTKTQAKRIGTEENTEVDKDMFITITYPKETTYLDQTGKFPVTSNQGFTYVFVGYDSASNYIQGLQIKNRVQQELTRATKELLTIIKNARRSPEYHILDNE